MKKIIIAFVVFVFSVSMLAGCGGSSNETPTSAPTSAPTSNVTETEAPNDETSADITVEILNSTGYTFTDLYISPSYEDWGLSLLGSDEIEQGDTYSVTAPGSTSTHDIKAADAEGDAYVIMNVTLDDDCKVDISLESAVVGALVTYSDGSTSYVEGSLELSEGEDSSDGGPALVFRNETPWAFSEIFVYEASSPDMGSNLIEDSSFDSGASVDVKVEKNYSSYDIELTDANGDYWDYAGVQLEDGCEVQVLAEDVPKLRVIFASGAEEEYTGEVN